MRWLFIDEQVQRGAFGQFFGLTFVAIRAEQLSRVRDDLISELLPVLSKEAHVIPRFPVLHGSDLLRGHEDADKLRAIEAVIRVVLQHELKIGRIVYYDKDFLGETIDFNRSIANASLLDLALHAFDDELVPIYEFDISRRNEIRNQVLSDFQYQYVRLKLPKLLSMPIGRFIGIHFAEKENHWMQITDIVSYVLWTAFRWKDSADLTTFKRAIVDLSEQLGPAIVYSEVIQINDPVSKPAVGPAGFRPIAKTFRVTPSDTEDLSVQAKRHEEHLRSVWDQRRGKRNTDAT